MLFNILIIIKTSLYVYLSHIRFNLALVLAMTAGISMTLVNLVDIRDFKLRDRAKILIYSLISLLMFVDLLYYQQFGSLPSIALLTQAKQLGAVSDSVLHLLNLGNLLLILDLPILLVFAGRLKTKRQKPLAYLGLSLGLIFFSLLTSSQGSLRGQELYSYHLADLIRNLSPKQEAEGLAFISQEDLDDLKDRGRLKEGRLTGLGQGRNLIVLQIEALQNFVIGRDYLGQELTPNLNSLIEDQSSIYYDRYYQLVGRGNTSDAEFVSNNSLHPAMEEPSYSRYEKNTFYGLPLLLKDRGYFPVAMHGYEADFWNRRAAYKSQGYEEFLHKDYYDKFDNIENIGLGISDRDFYRLSIDYLREHWEKTGQAFYSFMVSLSSHTPFKMPEKYRQLEIEDKYKDSILGNYLDSVAYADQQLGFFLDYLKEAGLYENSVIAIYGDHFAITAAREEDRSLMEDFLGYYDFDQMMNIPLIIHIPGVEGLGQTISTVGSQLDFYPTILNIMGYENDKGLIFGRDLSNYKGENLVTPQTYMMKGSFIDREDTFVMARDGIFEHGRGYNIKTRQPGKIEDYRKRYERAVSEINLSNYITESNLLKDYMEAGGRLRLGGELALEESSFESYRPNEKPQADYLLLDLDSQDYKKALGQYGKRIILSTSSDEPAIIKEIYREDLKENYVVIKDFSHYLDITYNKYERVILDPYSKGYGRQEILEFTKQHPGLGLMLRQEDLEDFEDIPVKKFIER